MVLHFPSSAGVSQGALRYIINNGLSSSVLITSSGNRGSRYIPSNLLTFQSPYCSEDNTLFGQWLMVEFKNHALDLSHYSIYCPVDDYPSNYYFSVSNDGKNWEIIHVKLNEVISTQKIFEAKGKAVRFFKWTMTGLSHGNNHFRFDQIDFFGDLFKLNEVVPRIPSCQFHHFVQILPFFASILSV